MVFLAVCLVSMGVMYGMVGWLERVTDEKPAEPEMEEKLNEAVETRKLKQ